MENNNEPEWARVEREHEEFMDQWRKETNEKMASNSKVIGLLFLVLLVVIFFFRS